MHTLSSCTQLHTKVLSHCLPEVSEEMVDLSLCMGSGHTEYKLSCASSTAYVSTALVPEI